MTATASEIVKAVTPLLPLSGIEVFEMAPGDRIDIGDSKEFTDYWPREASQRIIGAIVEECRNRHWHFEVDPIGVVGIFTKDCDDQEHPGDGIFFSGDSVTPVVLSACAAFKAAKEAAQ